jgi:hypothetical protein
VPQVSLRYRPDTPRQEKSSMSSSALMTWRPKPLLALRHEVRSAAARTTCSSCGAERSGPRPWCGAPLGTVAGGHARRHPGPPASAAPLAGLGDSGGQEPASVIAGQLGHADRQRRPGPAGLHLPAVPDRFPGRRGTHGRRRQRVRGAKSERHPARQPRLTGYPVTAFPQLSGDVAGTGFEPV